MEKNETKEIYFNDITALRVNPDYMFYYVHWTRYGIAIGLNLILVSTCKKELQNLFFLACVCVNKTNMFAFSYLPFTVCSIHEITPTQPL